MGFYIDMRRQGDDQEYREHEIPYGYWFLFALAGFALVCMGAAAATVFRDLARIGGTFDRVLLFSIVGIVPVYLFFGVKLTAIRRFVRYEGNTLEVGYRLGKRPVFVRRWDRAVIEEIALRNDRPSPNLALVEHDDPQYQIRGHWKLVAVKRDGRTVLLDRHVERGALEPMESDLESWLAGGPTRDLA